MVYILQVMLENSVNFVNHLNPDRFIKQLHVTAVLRMTSHVERHVMCFQVYFFAMLKAFIEQVLW